MKENYQRTVSLTFSHSVVCPSASRWVCSGKGLLPISGNVAGSNWVFIGVCGGSQVLVENVVPESCIDLETQCVNRGGGGGGGVSR